MRRTMGVCTLAALLAVACTQAEEHAPAPAPAHDPAPATTPAPAGEKPGAPEEIAADARFQARIAIIEDLLSPDASAANYEALATSLRLRGRYDEAAVYYLVSLKMRPKHARTSYRLAATFALWGQDKLALRYLKEAEEQGFWGFRLLDEDSDFEALKKNPEYAAVAAKVKERYEKEAARHAGDRTLKLPEGAAPEGGWPVLVLLHGWGATRADYDGVAALAAKAKFAALALDGQVVLDEGAYAWSATNLEETHAFVQKHLEACKDQGLNLKRVYLGGFSQGAKHAAALVAAHPEAYAGAIANSPGGQVKLPESFEPKGARPLFLMLGTQDYDVCKKTCADLEKLWKAAKQPVKIHTFEGGHRFPEEWETAYAEALGFLEKAQP
ncbi:MAG: dienelactone hydrolase family protein [Planctomycetota bacterium]|nr:dienelactone hydrolase family protein [Planctomycetota bacterium]